MAAEERFEHFVSSPPVVLASVIQAPLETKLADLRAGLEPWTVDPEASSYGVNLVVRDDTGRLMNRLEAPLVENHTAGELMSYVRRWCESCEPWRDFPWSKPDRAGSFNAAAPEPSAVAALIDDTPGPDIEVTAEGGKQSALSFRLDQLPPLATLQVGRVLKVGMKYGEGNWRLIPVKSHLNHALGHVLAYLAGDPTEGDLGHAACRLLMALELDLAAERAAAGAKGVTF